MHTDIPTAYGANKSQHAHNSFPDSTLSDLIGESMETIKLKENYI